jgi:hypothetical protein
MKTATKFAAGLVTALNLKAACGVASSLLAAPEPGAGGWLD